MKLSWSYFFIYFFFAGCNGGILNEINNFEINLKIISENNFFDYNDDIDLPTLDMIKRDGYPAEGHVVTTEDGYLLTLHRIPANNTDSRVVFLQHGLLSSSSDWIIAGREKSLAYLLHDDGYDVWLGNARGNTYSRAHIHWSIHDSQFWDFSFHEMGIHDLAAAINYITDLKRQGSLIYVGHSMGTTMGFIMASERPDIASKVKFMISLAPVAFLSNMKSPIRRLAPFASDIQLVARFLGVNEFLPQNIFIEYLAKYGCRATTTEKHVCENIMFALCGYDADQFNKTLLPVILSHAPAGTSIKNMIHFAQEINSDRFQQYDYGATKNLKIYNTTYAPDYDLAKINIPIALFYADNDWLVAKQDVKILYGKLKTNVSVYRVNNSNFNHLDFLWAIDCRKLVYNDVITLINQYYN